MKDKNINRLCNSYLGHFPAVYQYYSLKWSFLSCRPLAQLLAVYILRCIVAWWNKCQLLLLQGLVWKTSAALGSGTKTPSGHSPLPQGFPWWCVDTGIMKHQCNAWKTAAPKWSSCHTGSSQNFPFEPPLLFPQPPPSSYLSYDFGWRKVFSTGFSLPVGYVGNKGRTTPLCRVWCPLGIWEICVWETAEATRTCELQLCRKGWQETERKSLGWGMVRKSRAYFDHKKLPPEPSPSFLYLED